MSNINTGKTNPYTVYLSRAASIHAKIERLQDLADDHFGHDPDALGWGTSVISTVWNLHWTIC